LAICGGFASFTFSKRPRPHVDYATGSFLPPQSAGRVDVAVAHPTDTRVERARHRAERPPFTGFTLGGWSRSLSDL
jgi:hypothetical protein